MRGKNNYLCTNDLYSPVHNVLDAGRYITWGSGEKGVGAGNLEFLGTQMALSYRLVPFEGAQKTNNVLG
jgi:hypothetical protein